LFDRLVVNCNSYVKKSCEAIDCKRNCTKEVATIPISMMSRNSYKKFFLCLYVNKKILLICFIKEITKLFIANNLRRWKMFTFKHVRISSLCSVVQFVLHSLIPFFCEAIQFLIVYCHALLSLNEKMIYSSTTLHHHVN